ncbi:VOC family protein [Chloroflexota bacterium]
MKLKFERVTINVKNLEEAKRFFSDLLETPFVGKPAAFYEKIDKGEIKYETDIPPDAPPTEKFTFKNAVSHDLGIELFEQDPPPPRFGVRNITWRVDDIEKAKEEMKKKGIRLLGARKCGHWKEAVFSADDMYGVRWVLNEYEGPNVFEAQIRP